ncbi:MAG: hypothetical protein WCP79_10435 [Bacillota bacterium]
MECKWLPPLYAEPDWNNYRDYEEKLYKFFCYVYFSNSMYFKDLIVRYRFHPIVDGREEVFYHLTCRDYTKEKDRMPDPGRIIRSAWARAIIENYDCSFECCDEKPLYWAKTDSRSKKKRHMLFFQNYLVILEEREKYFLLITGYYVSEEYKRVGFIKDCETFKKQKTPQ